jgi:AGZA family xanthine/uracil permease-like MFS transporter
VLIRLFQGRAREVHPLMWVVAAAYLLFFAIGPIEAALGIH